MPIGTRTSKGTTALEIGVEVPAIDSPGYVWRVESIEYGRVHLRLFHDGERTDSTLDWAENRWHTFLRQQGIA